jgi:hypothetical protein
MRPLAERGDRNNITDPTTCEHHAPYASLNCGWYVHNGSKAAPPRVCVPKVRAINGHSLQQAQHLKVFQCWCLGAHHRSLCCCKMGQATAKAEGGAEAQGPETPVPGQNVVVPPGAAPRRALPRGQPPTHENRVEEEDREEERRYDYGGKVSDIVSYILADGCSRRVVTLVHQSTHAQVRRPALMEQCRCSEIPRIDL